MFDEFCWRAAPHTQGRSGDNLWEWLALAQHHGMPTRLLDWTTNPLAALWFAVRDAAESDEPGVVWLFTPDKKDLVVGLDESAFEVKRTRVFRPGHNTPRIIAQSGWFTVHKWRPADERFIALESNKLYKSVLYRIDVPKASFPGIREELARLDIHSASMFPDLGGLGTHVEWRYIRDSDE